MHRRTGHNKIVAAALLACFLTAIGLSMSFAVTHVHHRCTGDGCSVCAQIESCLQAVRQTAFGGLGVRPPSGGMTLPPAALLLPAGSACLPPASLLTLKIRLNN